MATKTFNAENVTIKMYCIFNEIGNGWSLVMEEYYDRETGKMVLQQKEMINVLGRWKNVQSFIDYRNKNYENICKDDWFFRDHFEKLSNLTYNI